jgi:hypothetical protein
LLREGAKGAGYGANLFARHAAGEDIIRSALVEFPAYLHQKIS